VSASTVHEQLQEATWALQQAEARLRLLVTALTEAGMAHLASVVTEWADRITEVLQRLTADRVGA
jgi:uncharacterized protein YdiU (UPF0061 family)